MKRLVCIEDLGNVDVLFTDKTGTLTEGRIAFTARRSTGQADRTRLARGLVCNGAGLQRRRDRRQRARPRALGRRRRASAPERRCWQTLGRAPVRPRAPAAPPSLADDAAGHGCLIAKGAPEAVLARCVQRPGRRRRRRSTGSFAAGTRVVAVATSRPSSAESSSSPATSSDLELDGFLCFVDPAEGRRRAVARAAGRASASTVKIVTGDNGQVAAQALRATSACAVGGTSHRRRPRRAGRRAPRRRRCRHTTIFARVSPEQKSRIIRAQRAPRRDASASSATASTTRSRCTTPTSASRSTPATDVAKDAADVVLLDKDLGILADGVVEGRRIFANTIKYVLMGTSSNFGNMFSAAGASLFLCVPADAADADPAQQPALRRQRDDDPDRQRRRGAARRAPRTGTSASSAAS